MSNIFPVTAAFLAHLQEQPEVLGACLVGSKSLGYNDYRSDDDVEVFLTIAAYNQLLPSACVKQHFEGEKLIYDVRYFSYTDLQQKQSSPHGTDHWPYQKAKVLFDRNGRIGETIRALSRMDTTFRNKRIRYSTLSTTIAIGKACKALQRGYEAASHITLARGAKALARLIFALEWRWTPTDHWLEKEVQTLSDSARVGPLLIEALTAANPLLLRTAIQQLEKIFPNDIPDSKERAKLYTEILHHDQRDDRESHLLL